MWKASATQLIVPELQTDIGHATASMQSAWLPERLWRAATKPPQQASQQPVSLLGSLRVTRKIPAQCSGRQSGFLARQDMDR